MSREAMQMALEALERYGGVDQRACDAEEALRQALETEREWVGLTDDEIDAAWRSVDYTVAYEQFRIDVARAVEQRLKKRNT